MRHGLKYYVPLSKHWYEHTSTRWEQHRRQSTTLSPPALARGRGEDTWEITANKDAGRVFLLLQGIGWQGRMGEVTYVTVRAGTTCNTAIHGRGIPRRCSCSVQLPFSYASVVAWQMHVKGRPIVSPSCQTWTVLKYCLGITTTCGTHRKQHNTSVSTI